MKNRIVTLFILISFLFNVCVFDVALGLSAASMCNDLMGIQYKDIGRIKVALEAQLRGFLEGREDGATIEDLKKALETATVKEETVYQAADMQFFFNEAAEVKEGVRVMCRIKDAQGIRTYYVVFALEKNEFGGFQVKGIYSEDEYKKHGELKETLPKRPEKDEKAIARYVQHEKGIDAIIRYAHENGLVDKPAKFILDIKEELPKLLKRLNVEISTPDGLTPIEDREIFIIDRGRLPGEMQVMLMNTTLVDESGKEFRVDCCAHSSNSAIYIFMPESFAYEALAGKGQHEEWVQEMAAETVRWVFYIHLAHEVGVICGLPAAPMVHHTPVPGDLPVPENEIDRRFRALNNADNIKPFVDMGPLKFEPLSLTVADLDKNLLTRDYAAGDQALRAQAILNTLCSTQPKLRKRAAEGFKRMFPHLANEIDAYFACLPVSGKKILEKAKEIGRPVIACNIDNGELSALQIRGLMKAALEADAFIMFEVGPAALKTYADGKPALPEYCAKEAYRLYQETGKSVVYAVHLDHNQISAKDFYGGTMQEKEKALQVAIKRAQLALIQGFTSFATDTSTLTELEKAEVVDRLENVIMTGAEILKVIYDGARELGISVGNEGEVGDIGKEVSTVEEAVTYYKELVSTLVVLSKELGVDFMKEPLIDIIALNIGTSHGYDFDENDRLKPYKPGRINVKRAKEVHQAFKAMGLNIGVALHGFSGTPIEHAKGFVDTGIAKVNINTDWQAIVWKVFEAYYPDAYKELFGLARELARKDPKKGPALVTDNEKYDLEHARNRIMFGFARKVFRDKKYHPLLEKIADLLKTGKKALPVAKEQRAEDHMDMKLTLDKSAQEITANEAIEVLTQDRGTELMEALQLKGAASAVKVDREEETRLQMWQIRKLEKAVKQEQRSEYEKLVSYAREAGREIPTHPESRYTLLVTSEFFSNGELEEQQKVYADRFNLDSVSAKTHEQFVDKVLAKASGVESRTIALVSDELPQAQLQRLLDAGIRFIRTDTNALLESRTEEKAARANFQRNTFVTMLLARCINEDTTEDSSIYKLLGFYLKTHFQLEEISVKDYIQAIITGNIALLIKGILMYKPVVPFDMPDYDKVAATLIAA